MQKNNWITLGKLLLCVAVPLAAGFLGSIFTAASVGDWYLALRKPAFTPPSWLFGPVWTVLYILMGVAAWLVWRRGWEAAGVPAALILFLVQLALNVGWSAAFFGGRSPGAGLAVIGALLAAVLATAFAFRRVSVPASLLLLPYIIWVGFATALNAAIWRLNR